MMKNLVIPLLVVFALILGACAPQAAPTPEVTQAPQPTTPPEPTAEPTQAPKDIVDIAVEDGRFTTLVAAVQAAGLVDTLKGEGPFTVFAPTDDAFAKLPEGTVEALLADLPQLTDILLYHVVPGKVMAADVLGLDGQMADTALEGKQIAVKIDAGKVILNENVMVVITDIEAANGVIHVVDAVLLPASDEMTEEMPAKNIVEIAVEDGRFTTLVAALQAAELVDTLSGEGPFTVFAPTDDAFAKLPEGTVDALLADIPQLTDILLYHVVSGKVMAADVIGLDGKMADTALEGKQIAVKIDGDKVMLNQDVMVVITDIEASNGVIHVVDTVLLPPAETTEKTIVEIAVEDGRFTTLVAALQAAELVETLSGEGPFTVFAPTDDAFAKLPAGTVEALLEDIPQLTNILLYHVVSGKVMAADVLTLDGQEVETALEGQMIMIKIDGDKVMLNQDVMVIITDIEAANGVIHVIDTVLLPPAE
jgi:transforming growth factor-beta-induced protein